MRKKDKIQARSLRGLSSIEYYTDIVYRWLNLIKLLRQDSHSLFGQSYYDRETNELLSAAYGKA